MPGVARRVRHLDTALILIIGAVMAAAYAAAYRAHPAHPHIGGDPGWWLWFDQERYFKAAQAWAGGDLDPQQHHYLPGYPLMAAPFVRLLSVHAFFVVDLICLLASLWLFTRLTVQLAPTIPHAASLGAVVFAATTVLSPLELDVWVVPWSTSGTAPLSYACLLAATGFVVQPQRWSQALLAGLCGSLVMAFRPLDLMPLVAACGLGMTVALAVERPGWRPAFRAAAATAAGGALAAALMALAYLPLYGMTRSHYVASSAAIGFDWGLVPLRWVSIVLSPQPLLSDGRGLIEAFPWIAAGMAGLGAFLTLRLPGAGRLVHVTVITAVILHTLIYLAYRDLNPGGLFRFWNYHYFKWTFPILALYGVLLVHALLTMPGRRAALLGTAAVTLLVLLPWRTELRVTGEVAQLPVSGANRLAFDSSLASVRDAVLVQASGDWGAIYLGSSALEVGGRSFGLGDIKPMPRPGGFVLVPLRPLPAGPAVLTMSPGVHIDHAQPVLTAHQDIVFGLPCWLPAALHECRPRLLFPPLPLPPNGEVPFDGSEAPFLSSDWSINGGVGRWTEGRSAELYFNLPPSPHGYRVNLSGYAYLPDGAPPLQLQMLFNDHPLLQESVAQQQPLSLSADIAPAMLKAGGQEATDGTLSLRFANPRRPKDYDPASSDARLLGLFVRSVVIKPQS